MKKEKAILLIIQIALAISGILFIGDWEVILGVVLLIWSNNLDYKLEGS